jgi:hypothetical protein
VDPENPQPSDEREVLPVSVPAPERRRTRALLAKAYRWLRLNVFGDEPIFGVAIVPLCILSMLLFTRNPFTTNFIFDEQEALLANPYVRSVADAEPRFGWLDAFRRDFWGLGPERTIGSYRPIPNLVWRALWALGARDQSPFLHHWVNVVFHGINGALVSTLMLRLTQRAAPSWIAGIAFTSSAVLTEAVSGVVGIADVLGATGALLALLALTTPPRTMLLLVFVGTLFGLGSKESAMCCVALVPFGVGWFARYTHSRRPEPIPRMLLALVSSVTAFVLYVEGRRRLFPTTLPAEFADTSNLDRGALRQGFAALLRWYAQPLLPRDPLNNPLVNADTAHRLGGALRVFWRGLGQVVFPWTLSGDYSAPQEPIPETLFNAEIVLGGVALLAPLPLLGWAYERSHRRSDGAGARGLDARIVAFSAVWIVGSFFPVSNIPVLLPTVRAERFWYFPVIGSSLLLGVVFGRLFERARASSTWATRRALFAMTLFFSVQWVAARLHANDYTDDLAFWDATRKAVPRSAKAHLNYSVMKGARGDLETRLSANAVALELAPEWPMASIYYGDTLCRLHRSQEAWPHYARGFDLAPNEVNLIALALQCLWDEKQLTRGGEVRSKLEASLGSHPGSWHDYLVRDILEHGDEHNGVAPKYRPRGYNEGPRN